jgi:hypothetical protein
MPARKEKSNFSSRDKLFNLDYAAYYDATMANEGMTGNIPCEN